MQVGNQLYLYHEKQDAALCGVHCLNSLLQGDYFTEVDLMQFAKELDEEERKVMMEMGMETKEFLQYFAVCSIYFSLVIYYRKILAMLRMMGIIVFKFSPKLWLSGIFKRFL